MSINKSNLSRVYLLHTNIHISIESVILSWFQLDKMYLVCDFKLFKLVYHVISGKTNSILVLLKNQLV